MDSIAEEIHHALPNHRYNDYVRDCLFGGDVADDPFELFPLDNVNAFYVSRGHVESELTRFENRVVLGNEGGGGTTLARWLSNEMLYSVNAYNYQTLAITIGPSDAWEPASLVSQQNNQYYEWPLSKLIALIFDAYWNQMIVEPLRREILLPHLRKNREWMLKLYWFYQHYPPNHYQIFHDFELCTWLNSALPHSPFGAQITDRDILQELIRFIVTVPFDPGRFLRCFSLALHKSHGHFDFTEDSVCPRI